ncbi:MAG: antibiotic biosynthesis monooxygenase [Anaerolineaceae bacterium]
MIERQVHLDVHPEKADEFEEFFKNEYRPAMSKSEGFVSLELLVDPREPGHYQMVIRFTDQACSDAWRASESHQQLSPRLKSMVPSLQVMVYEVVA